MDSERFDLFARAFSRPASRRRLVGAGFATVLTARGRNGLATKSHGKAKKKQRHHRRKEGTGPVASRCADRTRNGDETDVDCGGSCPRCVNGQTCRGQDDCDSGLCVSGVCRACVVDADCGIDAAGTCRCDTVDRETQQRVCNNALGGPSVASCDDCPEGTNCHRVGLGEWVCRTFCGVP